MGGGGEMSAPSLSPQLNGNVPSYMFLACDLTGLYRSTDGGQQWDFINQREMRAEQLATNLGGKNIPGCSIAFDFQNSGVMYRYGFGRGLRKSSDRGNTWGICEPEGDPLDPSTYVLATSIHVDPKNSNFVVYGRKTGGAFYSTQGGAQGTFSQCTANAAIGEVVSIVILEEAPAKVPRFYLATVDDVFLSTDGQSWTSYNAGFGAKIRSFSAGGSAKAARLYALIPSNNVSDPGIRVLDPASSAGWDSPKTGLNTKTNTDPDGCKAPKYMQLAAANNDPLTAYVTVCAAFSPGTWPSLMLDQTIGVFRTKDGGQSWQHVYHARDSHFDATYLTQTANVEAGWKEWEFASASASPANAIACCPRNSNIVLVSNQVATLTTDGGQTWREIYTTGPNPLPTVGGAGQAWRSRGLEPTTVWDYVAHPSNPQRQFIAYTDIGLSRSEDGGIKWKHVNTVSQAGRRLDNCYGLAFDPGNVDQIWAACTSEHDIPHEYELGLSIGNIDGGVLSSGDGGQTWTDISSAQMKGPCTSVLYEAGAQARLWAAVFGSGVFRTPLNAISWQDVSANLGNRGNKQFYSLRRHENTGAIYVSVAGLPTAQKSRKYFSDDLRQGGVFQWDETTQQWRSLTNPQGNDGRIWNVMDFNIHPDDASRLFVGLQGGKLSTGGNPPEGPYGSAVQVQYDPTHKTSTITSLPVPPLASHYSDTVQVFGAWFLPQNPNMIFITSTSHGIWYYDGTMWNEYKGLPYLRIQRLRWLLDANRVPISLFVSTFGGGAWQVNWP